MQPEIVDRTAVVFHGIVGGLDGRNGVGAPSNIADCAKTIHANVLSSVDHDVFMHSWSVDHADELISLYSPKAHLFQPQEMLGFSLTGAEMTNEEATHRFRTVSRHTSLERALSLKSACERAGNFRYRWVLALRYDLVFFTKLDLGPLDPQCVYVCSEPHWKDIHSLRMVHDIVFLTGSPLMDEYSRVAEEIRGGSYGDMLVHTHMLTYRKLMSMLGGDRSRIRYGFRRYHDVEVYRLVVRPELNPVGHPYGALEAGPRLQRLLESL